MCTMACMWQSEDNMQELVQAPSRLVPDKAQKEVRFSAEPCGRPQNFIFLEKGTKLELSLCGKALLNISKVLGSKAWVLSPAVQRQK